MVFLLGRYAWKPLLGALEDREERIKNERKSAEEARTTAEKIKADLEKEWSVIQVRMKEVLAKAEKDGNLSKEEILKSAHAETEKLVEKTRQQLKEEKDRLLREMRGEVADLTVLATEKILQKTLDRKSQQQLLEEVFKDLSGEARKLH